ncbi:MAG TPA: GNAT family N-acetyltransferase [Gaiellaceae bacterium]|nr:GNAT family N-acetyltransferase [Gaiellaceae bacterium]
MELVPAATFSDAELAALFTAGYEGYFMPIAIDADSFRFLARSFDYDLDASRVARDAEESVGLVMVARRDDEAWIGGLAVIPERRGAGVGRRLMEAAAAEARARGVRQIWLEVLVQNEPAIRLYEQLGYERVRELEVWALDGFDEERAEGTSVATEDAIGRVNDRPPWQRADETVANMDDAEALVTKSGTLIYRATGGTASLLQVAADDEHGARELLATLPEDMNSLRYMNGPVGDPVNAALRSLGGAEIARQHELMLRL